QQKIPIRTLGIPAFAASSGVLTEDNQTMSIPSGLAGDAQRDTAKYQLDIASSTLGPVLGNFNALIDYPYGCTEQTMSRLVPSMVAMQLHTKLHQPLSAADKAKFDKVYKIAMEKLTSYHHADGGWGWWQNDESNQYLTALVVDGMKMLKECGYSVDDSFITGGCTWLGKESDTLYSQLSDPKLNKQDRWTIWGRRTDLAAMLLTLSEFKKAPSQAETTWLVAHRKEYTPETLADLCLAYHNVKQDATARLFYDRLVSLANVGPETMDWEHTTAMFKRMNLMDVDDYTYCYTSVETTAMGLSCVLAMEPDNFDRIESIKKWIMLHRTKDGWDNTKTTSKVFLVLLQDELQARARGAGNFTARITLDSKLVDQFTANADNLYASQKTLNLSIPAGPTKLVIEKNGAGRLYYNSLMTYFRHMKPGDQVVEKAMPKGVKIVRQFFRMVPSKAGADGAIHFTTELIKDGKVKAGETIMMKVFVESPISLPYVMVDAALPSGAEVVEHDLVEDAIDSTATADGSTDANSDESGISGDWEPAWWSHQDILDDRIVFFGSEMPAGKSSFRAMLRMELPGKVNVNPVSFEGMYTNSVRGYSPLDQLTVSE
ncbi:MAG TPA: hypothetical protein V6C72_14465, partial [Chroococcales cyanobacterium]